MRDANEMDRLLSVDKDVYTPEEIAALFPSVSVDEVTNAVFRGTLPAVRAGEGIVGIHRADLLAWMRHEEQPKVTHRKPGDDDRT